GQGTGPDVVLPGGFALARRLAAARASRLGRARFGRRSFRRRGLGGGRRSGFGGALPGGLAGGDLVEAAAGHHRERPLLQDVRVTRPARALVLALDEEPRLLPLAGLLLHANEVPGASQLLAVQLEDQVTLAVAGARVA